MKKFNWPHFNFIVGVTTIIGFILSIFLNIEAMWYFVGIGFTFGAMGYIIYFRTTSLTLDNLRPEVPFMVLKSYSYGNKLFCLIRCANGEDEPQYLTLAKKDLKMDDEKKRLFLTSQGLYEKIENRMGRESITEDYIVLV